MFPIFLTISGLIYFLSVFKYKSFLAAFPTLSHIFIGHACILLLEDLSILCHSSPGVALPPFLSPHFFPMAICNAKAFTRFRVRHLLCVVINTGSQTDHYPSWCLFWRPVDSLFLHLLTLSLPSLCLFQTLHDFVFFLPVNSLSLLNFLLFFLWGEKTWAMELAVWLLGHPSNQWSLFYFYSRQTTTEMSRLAARGPDLGCAHVKCSSLFFCILSIDFLLSFFFPFLNFVSFPFMYLSFSH